MLVFNAWKFRFLWSSVNKKQKRRKVDGVKGKNKLLRGQTANK